MKSHRHVLTLDIPQRMDFVNITPQVEQAVRDSGVTEGLCLVNAMHITASVFINDDEPTGEDNADAHLKRQVMGREVVVAITDGQLDFGPWEQIFYGEFDGRRSKRILIKIIGE